MKENMLLEMKKRKQFYLNGYLRRHFITETEENNLPIPVEIILEWGVSIYFLEIVY